MGNLGGFPAASAGLLTAQAANAVLADTNNLGAGVYRVFGHVYTETGGTAGTFRLRHRNAADAADIAVYNYQLTIGGNTFFELVLRIAIGESLEIELLTTQGAGIDSQATVSGERISSVSSLSI